MKKHLMFNIGKMTGIEMGKELGHKEGFILKMFDCN